jgi:hypothetical protein
MRIGEYVFAVQSGRWWRYTPSSDENRPEARKCGRPNDVMCVLAKSAIRVSSTVRVKMHELDSASEDEQKCKEGDEQNTRKWV